MLASDRGLGVKRRNFMTVLAGGVAHPLLAGAQQNSKPMPVIGFLGAFPPVMNAQIDLEQAAFRRGLSETGYVEGQTWRSNTAGRTATMIGCRHWPPTSSHARST